MAKEQTLSLIKPDAVKKDLIGSIILRFERAGLKIVAAKMIHLSQKQAMDFYAVHAKRPFYDELVEFMSSGPIVALVLEGENAVDANRTIMGATNPKEAAKGTIRADYAESVGINAVHGSDSIENAKKEISFFFDSKEILSR